jgi:hypothetical protein
MTFRTSPLKHTRRTELQQQKSHGFVARNHRGQMLVVFLEREGPFLMNPLFKKQRQRKWTCQSADTMPKNEIDFIMADKWHIFRYISSMINRESEE